MFPILYAIFLVSTTLLALATLVYVVVDLVKKDPAAQKETAKKSAKRP